jgi:hypothetical protein
VISHASKKICFAENDFTSTKNLMEILLPLGIFFNSFV